METRNTKNVTKRDIFELLNRIIAEPDITQQRDIMANNKGQRALKLVKTGMQRSCGGFIIPTGQVMDKMKGGKTNNMEIQKRKEIEGELDEAESMSVGMEVRMQSLVRALRLMLE